MSARHFEVWSTGATLEACFESKEEAERYVETLARELGAKSIVRASLVSTGNPTSEVLDAAAKLMAKAERDDFGRPSNENLCSADLDDLDRALRRLPGR